MPNQFGFLFPGQGAQFVGMAKDLYERYPAVQEIFNQADQQLGYSLSKLCFEGPEDELTRTLYAQPAIFVSSYAALKILQNQYPDIRPDFVAGLSLGEFSALVAAGSFGFQEGLRLVSERSAAMEQAAGQNAGTMASIMGLDVAACEAVAKEAGCEVANLNSPDQIVLSGSVDSIEKACQLAEGRNAKRAIRLKVGGAFHSTLMQPAKERLEKALRETAIQAPSCTFIPNAVAQSVSEPEEIRQLLARQLTSPVRWIETMQRAKDSGIKTFLEIGPGKVLRGLARKCQADLTVIPCGSVEDLEKVASLLNGVQS